ncbi:DUF6279 family lipoprotein [Photobacterium sp. SDRW27]|uniref:DUF6279 family lipoprotein n=1 Tax=Photobacterium obscurum TaxID=2829490 RepID=UPI002243D5BB|nr:DUF6279 family lipoprotein [Photobacterium obscurum]MCW8327292.1 DUF6279 family lipoprotein [Photobacterium obscurum]
MPRKWIRTIAGLIILLMFSGCVMRLAYNTLDFWISYYLSDYVSLNSSQERTFDAELDKALAIHRRQELPKLHQLILELQADLVKPLTFSQVREYHDKFTVIGKDSVNLFATPLAVMLRQLDDLQMAQMNSKIESYIDELRQEREILTTKQKVSKRAKALHKAAGNWTGSLTSKQKALLAELAGYQVEMEPVFFTFWNQFLRDWRYLTKNRGKADFEAQLSQVLQRLVAFENSDVQLEINFYLNRRFDLMRRLSNSLDDKQRRYLDGRLTEIRKEVAVLINQ